MCIQSLDQEDSLEEEMATPVFLPGKSHRQWRLTGYSPMDSGAWQATVQGVAKIWT